MTVIGSVLNFKLTGLWLVWHVCEIFGIPMICCKLWWCSCIYLFTVNWHLESFCWHPCIVICILRGQKLMIVLFQAWFNTTTQSEIYIHGKFQSRRSWINKISRKWCKQLLFYCFIKDFVMWICWILML
jgi:hypothetical protein